MGELVELFGSDVFSEIDGAIFCEVCSKSFPNPRKFNLDQHIETAKHKRALSLKENSQAKRQEVMALAPSRRSQFVAELCEAFVKADIPLDKVRNAWLKKFLETWTSQHIPSPTTLRETYVPTLYEETLEEIRSSIGNSKIWVSIDETTDSCGRYVANVIVGKLSEERASPSHLLMCETLQRTNSTTIAQLFCRAMTFLWRGDIQHDRVLVFVTDAAAYMKKAFESLGVLFPKMCHVTCVAHGIHRVAEEIRRVFPEVDLLISSVKEIYRKAPSRVLSFQNALTIPLPPSPIVTRWGTWIEAALYYYENFEEVRGFVRTLDPEDAASIATAQETFQNPTLKNDLNLIRISFSKIPQVITELESAEMPLVDAIKLIDDFALDMRALSSRRLLPIKTKTINVFEKNTGLKQLKQISDMLRGNIGANDTFDRLSADDVANLRFAPIVSTEVERSFSRYKAFLRDNRRGFEFENMNKYVITLCN